MRLKEIKVGDYLDSISDYHANGSYKNLKKNITFKKKKDYAVVIRTLIQILMPQLSIDSLKSMAIALTTLERIAQSQEGMQLSEYVKNSELVEIKSWFDLRNKLRKISKAYSLIKQSTDQTTQWLGSDGHRYREVILANSLRLNYGQDEVVRLIPIKNNWVIQFVKTDFSATDGVIDQLFAALTLLTQYVKQI